jgi:hypothetical protein
MIEKFPFMLVLEAFRIFFQQPVELGTAQGERSSCHALFDCEQTFGNARFKTLPAV